MYFDIFKAFFANLDAQQVAKFTNIVQLVSCTNYLKAFQLGNLSDIFVFIN
jgi:hypothetical protein